MVTDSALLRVGEESYKNHSPDASKHLAGVEYTPVHRNRGIDGLLKQELGGLPAFVRVQRDNETIDEAVQALTKAAKNKGKCRLVVVATFLDSLETCCAKNVSVIPSTALSLARLHTIKEPREDGQESTSVAAAHNDYASA